MITGSCNKPSIDPPHTHTHS